MNKTILLFVCIVAVSLAAVEVPQHLLNEWADFQQDTSFLQTQSKTADAGGDFEFKCETTCQLVQKSATTGTTTPTTSTASGSGGDFEFKCETTCQLVQKAPATAAPVNNFLQTEAGLEVQSQQKLEQQQQLQAKTEAQTQQVKDCYRLCLNPSMNPGCDVAASAVSLLETGTMTQEELMRKNWSLGSGSGNCLNSCVHVCMAVHDSTSK